MCISFDLVKSKSKGKLMKVGVATVTLGGIAVLKMGRRIRMMVIQ